MASIKFILFALAAVIAAAEAGPEDGCTQLTDCAGNVEVALGGGDCTSSYGPAGRKAATLLGQPGVVCLQCPTSGSIDLSKFPYFTCGDKPLCGEVALLGQKIAVKPNQAKCIWENPSDASKCIAGCTPNAPSPAPTAGPSSAPSAAPSSGPSSAPSKAPSSGPSSAPSKAPSSGPSSAPSKAPSSGPSSVPSTTKPLPGSPKPDVPKPDNGCAAGELPVSVEGGQTGCAPVPICVGGFPNGNCPAGSHCGIVKTGVPGCKLGEGAKPTAGPGPKPTSGPAPGPTPTAGPSTGPTTKAPTSGPGPAPTSGAPGPAPTTGAPAPGVKCNPDEAQKDCAGALEIVSDTTGCAFSVTLAADRKVCVKCPDGFKKVENDPNSCFLYCGAKPQCGKLVSPLGNFDLTPNQGLCALTSSNPIGCIIKS